MESKKNVAARTGCETRCPCPNEPTVGVDAAATHALLEFISDIHQERKLTIPLVTIDLPLMRKHAQQVIWLHEGKVLHGTATDRSRPSASRKYSHSR